MNGNLNDIKRNNAAYRVKSLTDTFVGKLATVIASDGSEVDGVVTHVSLNADGVALYHLAGHPGTAFTGAKLSEKTAAA